MEANHDLILFCDADIMHSPTCFATGVSQLEVNDLDFVSFMHKIECESFWENVFIPPSLFPMTLQFALGGPRD